jgi:hypothetical protein
MIYFLLAAWQHVRFICFSTRGEIFMKMYNKMRLSVNGKYSQCGEDASCIYMSYVVTNEIKFVSFSERYNSEDS